ncbi:LOW QUALITY PROTEIN: serine-rich adhesin for platelets [Drosophila tropicalis]|uniref:LOW QUALITY PROTEIN: serine-rich adhesin for platelets n=1 Tax=Drosophila tropicalis TaxID=46794 RepID=UPI0035AC0571
MSKKMWNKIFKSKSQKQQQQLNKINKRHSRGIFEEYQQLNELLVGEEVENGCNENATPNAYGNGNGCGNGKGNINVFEQTPQQSSFNSSSLSEAQQQQQQQQQQQTQRQHHLSTFSRVCNTFSLRRNSNNNNNNIINNKQPPNAKSSITDSDTNACGDGEDFDVRPPGPLTTGQPIPFAEDPFDSAKPADLTPCPNCSRTFNLNALRKHVVICEKTSKKRKLFDSSRQRREGTSLSTYVLPKNFGLPNAEKAAGIHSPPLSSRDTAQPEVSTPLPTRRSSKTKIGGGASSSVAAPASSSSSAAPAAPALDRRDPKRSSDRLKRSIKDTASDRCPHCDRTFNPKAFDRHVEWCKEKAVQAAIKAANSTETAKAKERLDARKQYKPPNLKTKRSMNRDKYSHHEEVLEAGEVMAPKPNLMSLSAMTSSVHSENPQIKVQQPATPRLEGRRGRRGSITAVAENTVKLQMANDEEPEPPSPPTPQRAATLQSRSKRHQHANDTCDEVDATISRIRRAASREAVQLAKLDNDNNTEIVPRASTGKLRKAQSTIEKLDMIEVMSAQTNQVTMRFDELNGLIKRKGVTPISNVQMDEPQLKISTKSRSSTSLVRQARRRARTREHPSLEMRALELAAAGKLGSSSDIRAQMTDPLDIDSNDQMDRNLVPMQSAPRVLYSGSEDEGAEIQIKLETTTTRTVCRPKKRGNKLPQLTGSAEPMRALPMPQLQQSLEVLGHNISQSQLPRLELGNERLEEDDLHNDPISDEMEEMEVVAPTKSSAINRQIKSRTISRTNNNCTPELLEDQQRQIKSSTISRTMKVRSPVDLSLDQEELEPIKLPPLVKQGSNVSRRLVMLEQDENGTMYIKDAPSEGNNQVMDSNRSRTSGGGRNQVKRCDSSDEKLMRQQSNVSSISSHENDKEKRMADQQKREIFISIETEANAQGHSPISPDSLRHMVGNPQTKIDVLHIDNGNEPEHAKFSKISDTEDADGDLRFDDKVKQQQSQLTSSSKLLGANATPNVQLNNAKNLIQQMQNEFRQIGEDASASMRRAMLRTEELCTKEREREQQQKTEQTVTATSSHSGDSDEFSSLDGYPMSSSQSSRRDGANSKLSSDSAYGSSNSPYSLSRQRSSELAANTPRSGPLLRPHTANAKMMDASTQAQTAYGTLKARQRLFAGGAAGDGNPDGAESSSSASDNSVNNKNNNNKQPAQQQHQQQISNYNYQQQQQPLPHNNNNNLLPTPTTSQQSLASSNSSMSSSMKMSKFCHECGGKFILEHAKFCMECGVRRVVL